MQGKGGQTFPKTTLHELWMNDNEIFSIVLVRLPNSKRKNETAAVFETGCRSILFLVSSMKFALKKSDGKLSFYDPSFL
jgi:hypothetical protein